MKLPEIKDGSAAAKTYRRVREKARRAIVHYSPIASEAIGTLTPGTRLTCVTNGAFSLVDLIHAILEQTGPARLVISTWTVAPMDLEALAWIIEEGMAEDLVLAVDGGLKRFVPARAEYLVSRFGDRCIRSAPTHAKFVTVRNDMFNIAVRTSMNLTRNPRMEHLDLDDDPGLCDMLDALVESQPVGLSYESAKEWFAAQGAESRRAHRVAAAREARRKHRALIRARKEMGR